MSILIAYLLRARWFSLACLVVVTMAFALPPAGFGFPTCQFHELTHLPCMGCGLTRSFVGVAHGDLARAGFYHPVGIPLFVLTLAFAGLTPTRRGFRERCAARVLAHPRPVSAACIVLLAAFLLYGGGRLAYCAWLLRLGHPSPW